MATISIHGPRVGADLIRLHSGLHVIISIHGPRVGADRGSAHRRSGKGISIHGPRVGADHYSRLLVFKPDDFNPRPPCGGRRHRRDRPQIHIYDFNPRPPCGGRPHVVGKSTGRKRFQSTAPVWGPTRCQGKAYHNHGISIHGPRVGADHIQSVQVERWDNFNPRPPCGGRSKC